MKDSGKLKIHQAETMEDRDLPELPVWDEIIDRPETLADLDPTAGAAVEAATTDIAAIEDIVDDLGDLAFENLVTELLLAEEAVTNAKIAIDAVQGDVIAAGAITTTKIGSSAVEAANIAAGAIVAGKLATDSVVAANIQAGAVAASKISVTDLAAINANLGTVTAGNINGLTITGGTIRSASSGKRVQIDSDNAVKFYDSGGTLRATLEAGASSASRLQITATSIEVSGDIYPDGASNELGIGPTPWNRIHVNSISALDEANIIDLDFAGSIRTNQSYQPSSDNSIALGNASRRWSDLRSVLINGADIGLEHDWWITEGYKLGIAEPGVAFVDSTERLRFFIGQYGIYVPGGKIENLDTLPWVKTTIHQRKKMDIHAEERDVDKRSEASLKIPDTGDARPGGAVYKPVYLRKKGVLPKH